MEEKEDIFEKAVEALKNEPIPPGPPQGLADATIARLAESSKLSDTVQLENRFRIRERLRAARSFTKVAAAAVILIAAGYATGRWAAPRPPDIEQLRAALEPAIRQNLLNETRQYLQLGLASGYVQIRDELSRQYRQDLSRAAVQTLATSNALTNELLAKFIESIDATQVQDRRWVAAVLEQIELNRLRDTSQLSSAFATFAVQTEDELARTKRDVAQALSYAQPDSPVPYEFENSDKSNERSKK
jgi:hypothetical protein